MSYIKVRIDYGQTLVIPEEELVPLLRVLRTGRIEETPYNSPIQFKPIQDHKIEISVVTDKEYKLKVAKQKLFNEEKDGV